MAIHFSREQMERVKQSHIQWWEGRLGRPLMQIRISNAYARVQTPAPLLSQATCADFSLSAEDLIDTLDAELSTVEYLGDAYPHISMSSFGPGVLAAFCGARLDNSSGRVWFFSEEPPIEELHISYDPENKWVRRIKDIYRAGREKWDGSVLMGLPDLGGVMDVVASLRGTENLLLDLYDNPEEVLRVVTEAEKAWRAAYEDMAQAAGSAEYGYSDWDGLYSRETSYITQCDFCYMIGNDMFRRFVLPTLARDCEEMTNVIYHLDGIGELPHLDDILSLDKLKAVQWVFGDGQPSAPHWLDVYRRIAAAGKNMQIVGTPQDLMTVAEQVPGNMYLTAGCDIQNVEDYLRPIRHLI